MATTVTKRRTRAKRGQGEKLRSEILSAAQRLLLDTGDEEAVSIRAVADAVGVTPPSIYLHFADKEELLYAVCSKLFEELDELFEAEAAKGKDALESLRLKGHAYVRFGLEHPEHYRIMFMRKRDPEAEARQEADGTPAFEHLVDSVRRCMEAGAIPQADPLPGAIALWSIVHGLTSILISNKHMPGLEGNIDQLIDYHVCVGLFGLENAAEKMAAYS